MPKHPIPPIPANSVPRDPDGCMWVFGYGSLIWNPGFDFIETRLARLTGWHRRFCLWSTHYRGTVEQPGLVLGLDRGGCCNGVAFRVSPDMAAAALAYLDARELPDQTEHVYNRRTIRLALSCGTQVPAVTYTARRASSRYAGKLPAERIAHVLGASRGLTGSNRDYFLNTLVHLARLGIADRSFRDLEQLLPPTN